MLVLFGINYAFSKYQILINIERSRFHSTVASKLAHVFFFGMRISFKLRFDEIQMCKRMMCREHEANVTFSVLCGFLGQIEWALLSKRRDDS